MDLPLFLFALTLGALAGAFAAWLAGRSRVARLEERLDAERRAAGEKVTLLQRAETSLRDAFASLSAEALRQNNQSFLALAQTKLGEFQQSASSDLERRQQAVGDLVRPIQESLARVDGKLQEVEKERVASYAGLVEQVRAMAQTQQALHAETGNLVKALRAPQVRGRWASAITASRPAARQISSPSPSAASPTDLFHFATLKRKTAVTEDASSRIVRPKTLPPASSASDRRLLVQRAVRWPGHRTRERILSRDRLRSGKAAGFSSPPRRAF